MNEQRGIIRDEEEARKLVLYEGLRWDTITPTDIDGCVEFGDELFIFIEIKREGKELPYGQDLLLKRLVRRIRESGAHAYAIVGEHNFDGDIMLKDLHVNRYFDTLWRNTYEKITFKEFIDGKLKEHKITVS